MPDTTPAQKATGVTRIVLVSCWKSKVNLFRAARQYAKASGAPWFIVSGKHGLLEPGAEMSAPLNDTPPGISVAMAEWGHHVVDQLRDRLGDTELELEILGGVLYVAPIRHATADLQLPWTILDPLQGLELGERLAWLLRRSVPLPWAGGSSR